ncbi:CrcB family protein [Staphylococcus aureus]|uniref:Fluoride-specific ion channel n=1 Tax=Staphylococcus aureus TaxID=1280 RepID=A0A380DVH4_STAAU|nr:CrcB family protein [Staphylococcus aureus]
MQYVYIFIGGALGALLRYLISFLNTDGGFPIGTLVANLTGAFVMGLLTALTIAFFSNHPTLKKSYYDWFSWCFNDFFNISIRINTYV